MGSYVPNSKAEREAMLKVIGVSSVAELFSDVPEKMLLKDGAPIPAGLSEIEVSDKINEIADKNVIFKTILRGVGAYNHYIPAIVKSVVNKEQLVTAYTPYQAEISQVVPHVVYWPLQKKILCFQKALE